MEGAKWKRDKTPYLIFQCSKCHQYSYVKTAQKTKKCLRCNRIHHVQNLLGCGEIVKGLSAAVEKVKALQNDLAQNDLGVDPKLISDNGYSLPQKERLTPKSKKLHIIEQNSKEDGDYYPAFLVMLGELKASYKTFPPYLIRIMAENKGISDANLPSLIRKAIREGLLIQENKLFYFKS